MPKFCVTIIFVFQNFAILDVFNAYVNPPQGKPTISVKSELFSWCFLNILLEDLTSINIITSGMNKIINLYLIAVLYNLNKLSLSDPLKK